ncbi:MAG: cyanophycinase [Planctomycetes bacterium]|nr:cyanophycinase [Planctomycetota bacterium]
MKRTQRTLIFASLLFLFAAPPMPAQAPRIDPAGIPGALLICGGGDVSEAAFDRFIDLAGGAKAKVAVVHINDAEAVGPVLGGLKKSAKQKEAAEPMLVAWKDAKALLGERTGIWLITPKGQRDWQAEIKDHPLRAECLALLKRRGVIATSGRSSPLIGPGGLNVLPVVDHRSFEKKKPYHDGVVTIQLTTDATLEINGRTLSAVGAGITYLSVWSKGTTVRTAKLEGKAKEDLTAWLRTARDRLEGFPPRTPEPPVVEKGTLVIVGGGGSPVGLYPKFVEYAGGKDKANIVIFATANPDPLPKRDAVAEAFKKAGAKKATVLYAQKLADVESKEFLDTLKEATGLWFDGGRQWRFVDCYENTKALPLMFDVLKRGGVIGGTSAGATIQGDYLARGGVFDNFAIRYEGYERGLGFLKGVAIDQHFSKRNRFADMTSLMKTYPQYLGIGIDEATAIVVQGSVAEVIGKGKVHFYDAKRKAAKGDPDYEALPAGGRYELKERKVLSSEK